MDEKEEILFFFLQSVTFEEEYYIFRAKIKLRLGSVEDLNFSTSTSNFCTICSDKNSGV